MFRKVIIGIVILYLASVLVASGYTLFSVQREVRSLLVEKYREHFRASSALISSFFAEIQSDLLTLADHESVRAQDDTLFTSFLEADEDTFQYHYSEAEQDIIDLFSAYRARHSNVGSVYMGRANGSFVRSHPRTRPTRYDPRERPWYLAAMEAGGNPVLVDAYPSVTNNDVNIGCAVALVDDAGRAFGVIGMDVTLHRLSEELTYGGSMELIDARGIIIVSSDAERLNTVYDGAGGYDGETAFGDILLAKNGSFYRLASPSESPEGTWVAYAPKNAVEKQIWESLTSRILFSAGILVLMVVWSALLVDHQVTRPLRAMHVVLRDARKSGRQEPMNVPALGVLATFQEEYNRLVDQIDRDEQELTNAKRLTISSLTTLSRIRDNESGLHLTRTFKFVEMLANAFNEAQGKEVIPAHKIDLMAQCAPMHDIGKVAIPDEILLKPGPLSPDEYEVMKKHPVYGRETLLSEDAGLGDREFMETAVNVVYHHHEKWDGTGYPEGLAGDAIPIEARIMAIADAYDAITSKRVYKDAHTHARALDILRQDAGSHFDPDLVQAFLRVEQDIRAVAELYRDP
jgi:response regulator RpfG family c-di-GMP phosphodiesterase